MKPVRGLSAPPPGLQRFCDAQDQQQSWAAFGDFEGGSAKREVIENLATVQRGLC